LFYFSFFLLVPFLPFVLAESPPPFSFRDLSAPRSFPVSSKARSRERKEKEEKSGERRDFSLRPQARVVQAALDLAFLHFSSALWFLRGQGRLPHKTAHVTFGRPARFSGRPPEVETTIENKKKRPRKDRTGASTASGCLPGLQLGTRTARRTPSAQRCTHEFGATANFVSPFFNRWAVFIPGWPWRRK
jgi:hypothetical protein